MALLTARPGSSFAVEDAGHELLSMIKPFIAAVDRHAREARSLERGVAAAVRERPDLAQYFSTDPATVSETFGLRSDLMLPAANPPLTALRFATSANRGSLTLDDELQLPDLSRMMRLCTAGRFTPEQVRDELDQRLPELLDYFVDVGVITLEPAATDPSLEVPGVHRLQHASLLFRSETTGVLTDPHLHSDYEVWPERGGITRAELEGKVDAVLISHSHLDHWDVSTLMTFPKELPIVVPHVPRGSFLCDDMRARLCELGFTNVLDPPWYGPPIQVGDIEISVLPFYGEQPLTLAAPRHEALRNWGNTYVVRTPRCTSWVVIDSGNDPTGRATDVADHVRRTFGGVDFVLSNCRQFTAHPPLYITGGSYWLSVPPARMADFEWLTGQLLTLGPKGVAEICARAGARAFLPYAHWWAEPGQTPRGEDEHVERVRAELQRLDARIPVIAWTVGDRCDLSPGGEVRITPRG